MDGYPAHYISHNVPLVALFGLGTPDPNASDEIENEYSLLQERGIRISSESPDVTGPTAEELLNCFQDFDARDAAWNNRPGKGKMGSIGFTYRSAGRSILLPPHKAALPDGVDELPMTDSRSSSMVPSLHSPLSPLSPASPTYPDGIMDPLWFSKYQLLLPSALIAFFNFTLDYDRSTLHDNGLKNEINALKSSISASGYRFRLIVVLVAEDEGSGTEVGERVVNIRKSTVMDPKSLYYLSRNLSVVEIRAFIGTVLSNLQPGCIEYYRDLSKHARRKKNRNTIPPPTVSPTSGTSQILSTQGWNVRYDTKLGFFAEFRQEMEAASRSYESAYETLLDGDIFDSISSWSPRFNSTRLLADTLAIRILRCLLWSGQTTSAVQSWSNHRVRIRDLVDRKGKGTDMYGWEAWDARWSSVMAELIEKIDLPVFQTPEISQTSSPLVDKFEIFAPMEKSFSNELRSVPWDFLHHPGYWWDRSARHTRTRRELAADMPEEDKSPPPQTPTSATVSRTQVYDTYLCPEPHIESGDPGVESFDHSSLIVDTLQSAARQFSSRRQRRATEMARFQAGQELVRACRFEEAMTVIKPIWKTLSWRKEGWWDLVKEISAIVRTCALELRDVETLLIVEWELMSSFLPVQEDLTCNFSKCLETLDVQTRTSVALNSDETAPSLSASFAFGKATGNVGLVETVQLSIRSHFHSASSPIVLAYVDIYFSGGLRGMRLAHAPSSTPSSRNTRGLEFFEVISTDVQPNSETPSQTAESQSKLPRSAGNANLSFEPGQFKVFNLRLLPREAGGVQATEVKLVIAESLFDFEVNVPLTNLDFGADWWTPSGKGLWRKKLSSENHCHILIEPKPPKVKLTMPEVRSVYYANEVVKIRINVHNGEDDVADVRLSVSLSGGGETVPKLSWWQDGQEIDGGLTHSPTSRLDEHAIGEILADNSTDIVVAFKALPEMADFLLVARADYFVSSDPETPLTTQTKEKLSFIAPFEANYNFLPRIHTEPWPSYFLLNETQDNNKMQGIKQRWSLEARIECFASEPLTIFTNTLHFLETKHATVSQTASDDELDGAKAVNPEEQFDRVFSLEVQKTSLDDRRSALISARLDVVWARKDESDSRTKTSLMIPALAVPFGEPRVLVAAQVIHNDGSPPIIQARYTLENPSSHLLSFSLTMETNEDFAFSGPKAKSTQLVPVSRQEIGYNILPIRRGVWIRPVFRVLDTGFGQELRVHATEGCRDDKKGIAIWVAD